MRGKKSRPPLLSAPVSYPLLTWVTYPRNTAPTEQQAEVSAVKDTICLDMADMLTRIYYPNFDEDRLAHERARLCRAAVEWLDAGSSQLGWRHRYRDYIEGMALGLNPLPSTRPSLFHDSDVEALRSDWANVRADLLGVWSILSSMNHSLEHGSDEQHSGREPEIPSSRGKNARKTALDRDHTSGA